MDITLETLQGSLANIRKQRKDMWANFNQAVGAESVLEMLIAKAAEPDPEPPEEPDPELPDNTD